MNIGPGIFRTKLPIGFKAGGINCGVRKYRPDLGVIVSEVPCTTTAVYTQNVMKGAPLKYCEKLLPSTNIKAIITNSGQANAATGEQGEINNQSMADSLANQLDCHSHQVLTASTGVIGEQLAIDKIQSSMAELANNVTDIAEKFATAIMTTDLVPKTVQEQVTLSQGTVTITGVCKGSGMIHPNMATMLGYLLTDATLTIDQSQKMIKKVCDNSFNMISVDGDTSTNDCVFLMSNGMSECALLSEEDEAIFLQALQDVAILLAKSIASDGEGASKLIEVNVKGALEESSLKKIARDITLSPLVKTAINGESPNWGRIVAKIGGSIVDCDELLQCDVSIQGMKLFSQGELVIGASSECLKEKMASDTVVIDVELADPLNTVTAWGCDLSQKYVQINADYLS